MIDLAIWFCSFGVADLVAPLSSKPHLRHRLWLALILSGVTALGLSLAAGETPARIGLIAAFVTTTYAGWVGLRLKVGQEGDNEQSVMRSAGTEDGQRRRKELLAGWTIGYLALVFATVAASAAFLKAPSGGRASEFSTQLPYSVVNGAAFPKLFLGVGILLFLQASANAIVRLTLASIGTRVHKAEQTLKGGRLIGPLERSLIFGLVLAGAPTAAALVVSAKGLLRFPELNEVRSEDRVVNGTRRIDEVTEYLLVGSLVSWLLALAPVPLMR